MGPTIASHKQNEKIRNCFWMQAGIIRKKQCQINYDCPACRFDRILRKLAAENEKMRKNGEVPPGKRGAVIYWKDKIKDQPHWKRPCLHHMKGRINFRSCTHDYQCGDCDFNQYFYDQYTVHAVMQPADLLNINGFKVPQGFYFHQGHTWIKIEESFEVRVGIDDFAFRLLGTPDHIKAPLVGKEVKQNRPDILLTRGNNHAKVLSPVSGVVIDMNPRLSENGKIAKTDPYSDGWVMRVHAKDLRHDLKNLTIGNETKHFIERDLDKLYGVIEEVAGPLAADGGNLCDDIFGILPELGWDRLTRLFLRT